MPLMYKISLTPNRWHAVSDKESKSFSEHQHFTRICSGFTVSDVTNVVGKDKIFPAAKNAYASWWKILMCLQFHNRNKTRFSGMKISYASPLASFDSEQK